MWYLTSIDAQIQIMSINWKPSVLSELNIDDDSAEEFE